MIVSHRFQFVFMHNPKVGGTSVRQSLEHFGDAETRLYGTDPDPQSPLHRIDRAHIGIAEFAHYFPQDWARAAQYDCFMLWRAPGARILSSVNEYSRRFAETDIRFVDAPGRRDFLFRTLDLLNAQGRAEDILDRLEFTHFRPQWIFADHPEGRAVRQIPLAEIDTLFAEIGAKVGQQVTPPAANASEQLALPAGMGPLMSQSRLRKLATEAPLLRHITPVIRQALLRRQPQQSTGAAFDLSEADQTRLDAFVAEFYAEDLARLPG